jgi:murein DD-endopeptidase MepM/ murein hydrolase activator NlpD/SH3-like domain-containing protein
VGLFLAGPPIDARVIPVSGPDPFEKVSPYEQYRAQLRKKGLHESPAARAWLQAGEDALLDSVTVAVPFKETGHYSGKGAAAHSYRFRLPADGRVLIASAGKTKGAAPLFTDVFECPDDAGDPEPVAYLATGKSQLKLFAGAGKTYLVRLQPRLGYAGTYTVSLTLLPAFTFPVKGKDARAIGSYWGASREGGKRKHEGIDIFARRGTPVVAATDGVVSNVGKTRLGGKVVWVINKNLQAVYYAHLDKQLVKTGQLVKAGQVLGTVGNTGNAKTTPAHLHFGVYRGWGGPVNPLPYVKKAVVPAPAVTVALHRLGTRGRIIAKKALLRVSPSAKSQVRREIPAATVLTLTAGTGAWYRARLPDGTAGYVPAPLVETLTRSLRSIPVKSSQALLAEPQPEAAPIARLKAGTTVKVLGRFDAFLLVQNPAGQKGWIIRPENQYLSAAAE